MVPEVSDREVLPSRQVVSESCVHHERYKSPLWGYTHIDRRLFDVIFRNQYSLPKNLAEVRNAVFQLGLIIGLPQEGLELCKLIFVYFNYCIVPLVSASVDNLPCFQGIHETLGVPIIRLSHSQIERLFTDEEKQPSTDREFIFASLPVQEEIKPKKRLVSVVRTTIPVEWVKSALYRYTQIDKQLYDVIYANRLLLPDGLAVVSDRVSQLRKTIGLKTGNELKQGMKKLVYIYFKYCIQPLISSADEMTGSPPCFQSVHRTRGVPIIRLSESQIFRLFADEELRTNKFAHNFL